MQTLAMQAGSQCQCPLRPLPCPLLHLPPPWPQVLVEKCLGRRLCKKCGKNYNIANIYLPASNGRPEIVMPPLSPPAECVEHMEQRSDDTEPVIRRRLEVYAREAQPVERFYAERGKLLDFEIFGGIPQASRDWLVTGPDNAC